MLARQIRMIWGKSLLAEIQFPLSNSLRVNCGSPGSRNRVCLKVIIALKMPSSASYLESCPRPRHVL